MEYISNNENDTFKIAQVVAKNIKAGDVVLLKGDLGAGKTNFTKGLAKSLGIEEIVTSPTFTILNEHYGNDLNLYHFDFYRLEDENELKELGFDEFIGKTDGICVIEWFEKAPSILPKTFIYIEIEKLGDYERKFIISFNKGKNDLNF